MDSQDFTADLLRLELLIGHLNGYLELPLLCLEVRGKDQAGVQIQNLLVVQIIFKVGSRKIIQEATEEGEDMKGMNHGLLQH